LKQLLIRALFSKSHPRFAYCNKFLLSNSGYYICCEPKFFAMINPYAYRAGMIAAGISVIWTIFAYLIGIELFTNWWAGLIFLIVMVAYLVSSTIKIRTFQGGYITFANAFLNFLVMAVIFTFIGQLFNYILIHVIDPEFGVAFADATIEKTIAMMEGFGAPEAAIEEALVGMEEDFESQASFLGNLWSTIKGIGFMAIIGLIVAAIIKKNPPVFDHVDTVD
jgi:hypothetical protein